MIKFNDEQIKSMRDGIPSEYDFEEIITSLSYEVDELRECLKEAVDYCCSLCKSKGKACEFDGFCSE